MRNKLLTKDGDITAYGFGCGYQEREEKNGITTRLYQEHGVYSIVQFDYNTFKRVLWLQTPHLKEARSMYRKAVKNA